MSKQEDLHRQRMVLFMRQKGKCHYCSGDMILMWRVPPGRHPDNLCTLEHLRDRFDPYRQVQAVRGTGDYRRVAACFKCNGAVSNERQRNLPIEELWRRSGRYPQTIHETLAQRTEQRISNPKVPGSNPGGLANG